MVSSNNLPPKAIINVYWSDGRGKHVSTRVLSIVPVDGLLVVDEIVMEIAKRYGSITIDAADMMLIEKVIGLEINNLRGLRLGRVLS